MFSFGSVFGGDLPVGVGAGSFFTGDDVAVAVSVGTSLVGGQLMVVVLE